jgi:hypothetical protein
LKILTVIEVAFFVLVIALCLIASYRFIDNPPKIATATLIIFNIFFISMFFQLNSSVTLKMGILSLGNLIGFLWNLFFYYVSLTGHGYFSLSFATFTTLAYPFLNLMWIVPFWSLSLSTLPKLNSANHT